MEDKFTLYDRWNTDSDLIEIEEPDKKDKED